MARLTAAQKREIEEKEQQERFSRELEEYRSSILSKLLDLVSEAQKELEIDVQVTSKELDNGDKVYFVRLYDSPSKDRCSVNSAIPGSITELSNSTWNLTGAFDLIDRVRQRRLKAEEAQKIRSAALAKLSAEERRVLGLV